MKKRLELARRTDTLGDLRGVISSLKTLAIAEVSRTSRDIERQRQLEVGLEEVLRDVLASSALTVTRAADSSDVVGRAPAGAAPAAAPVAGVAPAAAPVAGAAPAAASAAAPAVGAAPAAAPAAGAAPAGAAPAAGAAGRGPLLVIGAERGFCGGFNGPLVDAAVEGARAGRRVITVGRKLANNLPPSVTPAATLRGPGGLEEVPAVMVELIGTVLRQVDASAAVPVQLESLTVIYQQDVEGQARIQTRTPFAAAEQPGPQRAWPLSYHFPRREFLRQFLEQYLYFFLRGTLLHSFYAENRQRLLHLDAGLTRLDHQLDDLTRLGRRLRQEEITQEIEVILLTTAGDVVPASSADQ